MSTSILISSPRPCATRCESQAQCGCLHAVRAFVFFVRHMTPITRTCDDIAVRYGMCQSSEGHVGFSIETLMFLTTLISEAATEPHPSHSPHNLLEFPKSTKMISYPPFLDIPTRFLTSFLCALVISPILAQCSAHLGPLHFIILITKHELSCEY